MSAALATRPVDDLSPEEWLDFDWRRDKTGGSDACWPWTGALNGDGYGLFSRAGVQVRAHRVAVMAALDELVDHRCRNPRCTNPNHLRKATRKLNAENVAPGARSDNLTSEHRGVHFDKSRGLWQAYVNHGGRRVFSARFRTEDEAAKAARAARLRLHTFNEADRA